MSLGVNLTDQLSAKSAKRLSATPRHPWPWFLLPSISYMMSLYWYQPLGSYQSRYDHHSKHGKEPLIQIYLYYIYISIYIYIYIYLYLSISIYICLSVYLSICLSVYLSIYLSVYLSLLSIYLSIHPSIYLSIYLSMEGSQKILSLPALPTGIRKQDSLTKIVENVAT